jgi:hypothetical protein
MYFYTYFLIILVIFISCESAPMKINDTTKVANSCTESELLRACPVGTTPNLMADTSSVCSANDSVDFENVSGLKDLDDVSNICIGNGSCKIVCELFMPCTNGVKTITKESIECADTTSTICGNAICEASETSNNCPQDCAGECEAGKERCNGNDRQICSPMLKWDTVSCSTGKICQESEQNIDQTLCIEMR